VVLAGFTGWALVGAFTGSGGPLAGSSNPDSTFGDHWLVTLDRRTLWGTGVVWGLVALATLGAMRTGRGRSLRPVLLGVGWATAGFLALVLPGNLSLYLIPGFNLLVLGRVGTGELTIGALFTAGLALGVATLRHQRATGSGCTTCGRRADGGRTEHAWRRVGTVAAVAATVAPQGYALVRIGWALGIPIGATPEFLQTINEANPGNTTVVMELVLAGLATAGGVLCWGLTRPWSRRWPRWVPWLRGRDVPRWLPTWLGIVCGAGLFGYGTMLVPGIVAFALGRVTHFPGTDVPMTWASQVPAVALVVWPVLVLLSAVAFAFHTRPTCSTCGRGPGSVRTASARR
jgi:hypothetical protein